MKLLNNTLLLLAVLAAGTQGALAQGGGDASSRNSGLALPRNTATVGPELGQKHYRRGNTCSGLERYDDAIKESRLSLTADPNFPDSYRNLANIYYFQERYDETIEMLQRYIEKNPATDASLTASLNTLGELLRKADRLDEALPIDLRAIPQDPDNTSQVFVMGNTYFNAGRIEDAIAIYKKALEVNPGEAFFHRTLGRMYEDANQLEEALSEYRAASELDPGSTFYKDLVSSLEQRLGN